MTPIDYILLIVAVLVLIYQLNLLVKIKRTVIIKGTPPNRRAVAILMAVILVLAVVRTENLARTWPVFVVMALVCMMVFAGGSGLSHEGMYSSGRFISFKTAEYYSFDDRFREGLTFRLTKLTKEVSMIIDPAQKDAIIKLMEENRIPTFDEYKSRTSDRLHSRAQATQRKKKKKK